MEKIFKGKFKKYVIGKEIDGRLLESIGYEHPGKRIEINIRTSEFTCLCPWSGLPDYADITINYVPDRKCIELKSLKYYLLSFRNTGIVHESAVNRIMDDLVKLCNPVEMHVIAEFGIRGGIKTTVKRDYYV